MLKHPRVGDECWEVEWRGPDKEESDEPNYLTRTFPTRELALAWAKANFSKAEENGVPLMLITPYRFEAYDEGDPNPYAGFWEAADESECYEGES